MLTNDQVLGKGRYRIISSQAQDENGGLYEAYDTVGNANVVLRESGGSGKVMTATQLDELKDVFAGEAKALAEVRHGSLLNVQDYFSEIDRHYLVMEPVDGSDLTRFFAVDAEQPAVSDVLAWADQLLDALEFLHTLPKPIIHRDIRPASVRLTSNFKVKLLTAGIEPAADVIMASAGNQMDAAVLNYRPLEQLWGGLDPASQKVIANSYDDAARRELYKPLDARSDLYSLAATLYHLLSRTVPKDALERSIELLDGKSDPLEPLSAVAPSVSEEVSALIMKALEIRREDRFQSAAAMRDSLATARGVATPERVAPSRSTPEPAAKALPQTPVVSQVKPEATQAAVIEPPIKAHEQKVAQPVSDEPLLLEVEPVHTSAAPVDAFEWSEEELYVSEAPTRKAKRSIHDSIDVDFGMKPVSSGNFKFIAAAAAALIVVVAIVGWVFIGGSSTPQQAVESKPQQIQSAPPQEQAPVSTFSEPSASNTAQTPQTESTSNVTDPPVTGAPAANSAAQTKQKKPTATPAKTPEKKKVTVDDLINDN
jgi:serine/threonine protein kinase